MLKVTVTFEIDASIDDEEEIKEEIEYALADALENDSLDYSVEEIEEEEDVEW